MTTTTTTVHRLTQRRPAVLKRVVSAAALCCALACASVNAELALNPKAHIRAGSAGVDRASAIDSIRVPKPRTLPGPTRRDPTGNGQPPINVSFVIGSSGSVDDDGCEGAGSGLCASAVRVADNGHFYLQEFSMFYVVGAGIRLPDDVKEF